MYAHCWLLLGKCMHEKIEKKNEILNEKKNDDVNFVSLAYFGM